MRWFSHFSVSSENATVHLTTMAWTAGVCNPQCHMQRENVVILTFIYCDVVVGHRENLIHVENRVLRGQLGIKDACFMVSTISKHTTAYAI